MDVIGPLLTECLRSFSVELASTIQLSPVVLLKAAQHHLIHSRARATTGNVYHRAMSDFVHDQILCSLSFDIASYFIILLFLVFFHFVLTCLQNIVYLTNDCGRTYKQIYTRISIREDQLNCGIFVH